jgi:hypothetical protein
VRSRTFMPVMTRAEHWRTTTQSARRCGIDARFVPRPEYEIRRFGRGQHEANTWVVREIASISMIQSITLEGQSKTRQICFPETLLPGR